MDPDYTEFGIKIHKLRLTLKVQRRATSHRSLSVDTGSPTRANLVTNSSLGMSATTTNVDCVRPQVAAPVRRRPRRRAPRSNSSSNASAFSTLTQNLRTLDLDSSARSRRPLLASSSTSDKNVTSTPNNNNNHQNNSQNLNNNSQNSTASNRLDSYCRLATDEFVYARPPASPAADSALATLSFVSSADYDVIEEEEEVKDENVNKFVYHHVKMKSMTALENAPKQMLINARSMEDIAKPPLPPRFESGNGRPPLPPYPSSVVRASEMQSMRPSLID